MANEEDAGLELLDRIKSLEAIIDARKGFWGENRYKSLLKKYTDWAADEGELKFYRKLQKLLEK